MSESVVYPLRGWLCVALALIPIADCADPGLQRPSTRPAAESHPAVAQATRPAYNSGPGFFIAHGKLYDANGVEFRIRGVNRLHWDSNSAAGIAASGANTERWNLNFSRPAGGNVALIRAQGIAQRIVPIVGNWGATCSNDPTRLAAVVSTWVQQARAWTRLDRYLIVNIANEWGPTNDPVWRDSYIHAIAQLRAAGYLGTILVDSGGCGQDIDDLLRYSGAVFASDPQKNVMFALHIYGRIPREQVADDLAHLAAVGREQGMVFLVGEFGPGRNIGPSPTLTTPEEVISAAEANGIGWLAWAWDDNNRPQGGSDDHWFSMTYHGPGRYGRAADLTQFGRDVVLSPSYGLKSLATRASIFR